MIEGKDKTLPDDTRIALVTGANRGIGLEVVRQLAQRGMTVILGARDLEKGEEAAERLTNERLSVFARRLDVTDHDSINCLAAEVEREFGRVDVLINNAGIHYDNWQRATNASMDTAHEAMETNLFGAWRVAQAFVPLVRKSKQGRIVNVSSEAGSLTGIGAGTPAYSVSKAALNAFTRVLAAELKDTGILVNAVCPGWVATDMGGTGGRPIEEGAASVVWAATLQDVDTTGGFWRDGKPLPW
jgi:NAD(P)-dependent dehydrogenase (short-subunit alcohol dehydrogenase family)